MPQSAWQTARQRDFTKGENLSTLPEKVGRDQLIRMENAIISPQGEVTDAWQTSPLFTNVSGGLVVVPIVGSSNSRVYMADGDNIVSFIFNPQSSTPYDMTLASTYPGYTTHTFPGPVTIQGMSNGVPFLGKYYCCATTSLYITSGELTISLLVPPTATLGNPNTGPATVTNTTAGPVIVTGINFTGTDAALFSAEGSWPQTLAPGGTYTFNVVFTPLTVGLKTVTINVNSSIGILQDSVSLIGGTSLTASVSSIGFDTVTNGVSSQRTVTLTNPNSQDITITSQTVTGAGMAVSGLGTSIPANSSVPVTVTFTPAASGAVSGSFSVATPAGTTTVTLAGTGTADVVIVKQVGSLYQPINPLAISFGNVTVGTNSARAIALSNVSIANVSITASAVTGAGITATVPTGLVAAGAKAPANITFAPTSAGPVAGMLVITTSAGTIDIPLSGTGI